jgi:cyanophycin synthetase
VEGKPQQGAVRMNIQWVRHIDGPNVYLYKPILIARIELGVYTERESIDFKGFSDRLLQLLPGLRDHHCAKGRPGGFVERLNEGTYFGHILEHVTIELATCIGLDVHYGKTMLADRKGLYNIVMECKAFECQKELLAEAIGVIEAVLANQPVNLLTIFEKAGRVLAGTELGPSTQAIYDACLNRMIPVRRIGSKSMLELGYGVYRKRVQATVTEATSAVAVDIACDKDLTKEILQTSGVPVPVGGVANTVEEAVSLFHELKCPVVVKPLNGNQGHGVSLDLCTDEAITEAYAIASEYSSTVVVEPYIEGINVRLLVIDGKCVAASERLPANITGDGIHTIEQLVEQSNHDERRGSGHEKPLTKIRIDAVVEATLRQKGFSLADIPPAGVCVHLRESANLSTGGEARDVTNAIHISYRLLAERAARFVGLDVCGVDMVVTDLGEPATQKNCAVIEVNAAPGIRMHEHPSYGEPQNVAQSIVKALYPDGQDGRIPIVSVTGTNGKTTTTRLIGHALSVQGKRVGMTTTSGVFVDGKLVMDGDTTGPSSARIVLSDPTVEVAVLETARGGIVRGGLAYDKANVAVITNIAMDHIGQDGVDTIEDLIRIKSLVAECVHRDGVVVLNADNEPALNLSARLQSEVVLFSMHAGNKAVLQHLAQGGTAYYRHHDCIVEAHGNFAWDIAEISAISLTMGGTAKFHIENCLAAAAALRAIGLSRTQVGDALVSFQPDLQNRGRCMIYRMPNNSHVVLDYGHNPAGFERVGEWLRLTPHRSLIGVVGVPGDRATHIIEQSGKSLAAIFDSFVVKEDLDKRGRREGEVAMIIARQIRVNAPQKPCTIILSEKEALISATRSCKPGDIVTMFYEKFAPLDEWLKSAGGQPVAAIEPVQVTSGYRVML